MKTTTSLSMEWNHEEAGEIAKIEMNMTKPLVYKSIKMYEVNITCFRERLLQNLVCYIVLVQEPRFNFIGPNLIKSIQHDSEAVTFAEHTSIVKAREV